MKLRLRFASGREQNRGLESLDRFGGSGGGAAAAEVMKAALCAATRASHESTRIAKIREILERARRDLNAIKKK